MKKRLLEYKDLSRAPLANHGRAAMARLQRQLNNLPMFEPRAVLEWITSYLKYAFLPRHRFLPATAAPNGTSCYEIGNQLRISVAGDWGTGTDEAELVAKQMMVWEDRREPDLTIHLGDVYYVGDKHEIQVNCLGMPGKTVSGVKWPIGKLGSFALNGNHEMYANGRAYFDTFLPKLGMLDEKRTPMGQGPSFFCLENDYWRIIGIDTAYNSVGLPIISYWVSGNCKLPDGTISWLRDVVRPQEKPKATLVLSHHQYYSAFEGHYPMPAQQLAEFFDMPVIWLWGHEHRFAGYQCYGGDKLQAYGRCIGHGGMPIEARAPNPKSSIQDKLQFYDARINPLYAADRLGYNGFVRMRLEDAEMELEYLSLSTAHPSPGSHYSGRPETLVRERFRCDGEKITQMGVERVCRDEALVVREERK